MAIEAGATIHYGSKRDPEECQIIAAGPKDSSAVAFGEIFHTDHPNHVSFQLNDKLAPGAYSYLIIIDGVGLICTCLWRKQKKSGRYLNETIAWYESHYELNRRPIKRVGGKGDFSLLTNISMTADTTLARQGASRLHVGFRDEVCNYQRGSAKLSRF